MPDIYILRPYLKADGGTPLGTCTITTNWTKNSNNSYYSQKVAMSGITTANHPMISCTSSSDSAQYNRLIAAEAYEGGITFTATEPTTKSLTVNVINWTDKLILSNLFVNDFSLGVELNNLQEKVTTNTNNIKRLTGVRKITLGEDSWSFDSTNGYYVQSVSVSGILETDAPVLDIELSGNAAAMTALQKEWAKVLKAETYNGGIKFYANAATTETLTVLVHGGGQ